MDLVQAYVEYTSYVLSGEWLRAYISHLFGGLPVSFTDLMLILAVALLVPFALGLITGSGGVIYTTLLVLAALLFFGLLIVGGTVLYAVGFLLLATLLLAAYLFYTADPIVKAAVVVAAVAGLVVLARRSSAEEEDVVMEEECMPLKEGLKVLPLDIRTAIRKVLKKPASYHKLCFHIYRGRGVAGGRDLVMVLDLFTVLSETAVRISKKLNELGYPSVADVDAGRIYFKFKPDKTAQFTATAAQYT